jgi:type IV pilus assembly protein PilE
MRCKFAMHTAFASFRRVGLHCHRRSGFSLIELMVAVAIVGILVAIAYPSYVEQVRRSQRADAQTVLMEGAQFMQRWYAAKNSYSGADAKLPYTRSPKDGTQRYTISVEVPEDDPQSFTLTAAPSATDAKCGNFTLTHTGQKGLSGTHSGEVPDCWR